MRKILLPPIILALCLIAIVGINYFGFAIKVVFSGSFALAATISGYGLIFLGAFLLVWCKRLFQQHETNILPFRDPDQIVTGGPFGFSRNPMYLAMLLVALGVAFIYGTALSFIFPLAFFCIANWYHIPYEESRMSEIFGDKFTAYKANVRRWI